MHVACGTGAPASSTQLFPEHLRAARTLHADTGLHVVACRLLIHSFEFYNSFMCVTLKYFFSVVVLLAPNPAAKPLYSD